MAVVGVGEGDGVVSGVMLGLGGVATGGAQANRTSRTTAGHVLLPFTPLRNARTPCEV